MRQLLLKRLLQLIAVSWGVGTLTFILMRSLPGDMAYRIAASRYGMDAVDSRAADIVREELGLDQGALSAYWQWFTDLLSWNLGNSLVSGAPVSESLWHMLGHSLLLAGAGMAIALIIAIPLGLASAYWGGWLDRTLLTVSTVMRAVPVFVIGLLAVIVFALEWNLFPVAGFGTPAHLVLPALTLALSLAAISNRVIHTEAKRVFGSSFYEFARMKGLSPWQAFKHHGIRNIAVPVVAFLGIQLITVVEGVVMIESLFSWPGIGHGLAHAIFARDIPLIQGAALMMGVMFVVLNTLVDIACHYLDPRGGRIA
ncbi:MAG: ABC transporter permease [Marinomonas sp.]|jgi:peptide/nickel transport system permease protein|uniref:ABC transporter permease n=1 Tax=Marinomonas communis TaxID=28254 RepID=UPI000C4C05C1|nr:ABC transporter permease [Marinomonas communis]MAF15988.1 ABC transporter permease [Marinomonas sp.]MCC4273576.1 ABC transporter permease [Marinomonas communis]RUM57467.1 MAG: ABC transporter permease [Marinomonas sp.]